METRIEQDFHLFCIKAYVFLDVTQGHANFFELHVIVNGQWTYYWL